jgi:hypothetical protein
VVVEVPGEGLAPNAKAGVSGDELALGLGKGETELREP